MANHIYTIIDKGTPEKDKIFLSSLYESRKDAVTNDSWMMYCNNETNYIDHEESTDVQHFISNRLPSKS